MRTTRFAEVDLLRTTAITLMIVYHAAFDLSWFYGWDIDVLNGGWKWLAHVTASLFLVLVGVSAVLLRKNMQAKGADAASIRLRFVQRGLWVLTCGMLVSLATVAVDPATFVRFGILHLIGVSLLVLPFVLRLGVWNLLLALPLLASYMLTAVPHDASPLFIPFGFFPASFATVDYYPLLPWFGMVLAGAGLGHLFYARTTPLSHPDSPVRRRIDAFGASASGGWFTAPGRHSLLLYMVHQPLLLLILWLMLGKPAGV